MLWDKYGVFAVVKSIEKRTWLLESKQKKSRGFEGNYFKRWGDVMRVGVTDLGEKEKGIVHDGVSSKLKESSVQSRLGEEDKDLR